MSPLPPITVFVCTSCKRPLPGVGPEAFDTPGADFATELLSRLDGQNIIVEPIECLAVCKRPLTIALSGEGRFLYLIGDLDPALHLDDVVCASRAYAATSNGIVPWRERPQTFRKGVVARVPPLGFKQPEPVT